jgi:hypothetical protein
MCSINIQPDSFDAIWITVQIQVFQGSARDQFIQNQLQTFIREVVAGQV